MKVIMYHYVRPLDKVENGNLRYLTTDQFKSQLDFFEKKFGILSPDEFKHNFENKINTNKVFLTFDDGLKDHYEHVFPIMKERGLRGIFFIPTSIFDCEIILKVHKVHHLLSKYDSKKLYKDCLDLIDLSIIKLNNYSSSEIYKYSKHDDYEYKVKRLFNYELNHRYGEIILEKIFENYAISRDLFKKTYLTRNQLIEMKEDGQIIGSHTVNHKILSSLKYEIQKLEILESFKSLSEFYSSNFKAISYPYGYKFTYSDTTLSILEDQHLNFGFIFDNKESFSFKKFEISRIDCNNFIFDG